MGRSSDRHRRSDTPRRRDGVYHHYHSAGHADSCPPEEPWLSDLTKMKPSLNFKMDSCNDSAGVSSHEYPPPRCKSTNNSQHGMSWGERGLLLQLMTQKLTFNEDEDWENMLLCLGLEENGYCQDPCLIDDGKCGNIHEERSPHSLSLEGHILNEAISWIEDDFEEEIDIKLKKSSPVMTITDLQLILKTQWGCEKTC